MTRDISKPALTAGAGLSLLFLLMPIGPSAAAEGVPPPGAGLLKPPPPMPSGPGDGPGPGGPPSGPLAELSNAEADQVAAKVIADNAKVPLVEVQRMVRAFGVPTALRYYDVPRETFRNATLPGLVAVVRAAAQDNRIPGADADRIVDDLQHPRPPSPPMQ